MNDKLPALVILGESSVVKHGSGAAAVPAAIAAAGEQASWRYLEFFAAN